MPRPPPPPDVRIAPLLPLPALLAEAGIDPEPLLAAAGIEAAVFAGADGDVRVPYPAAARLLHDAAAAMGREDFGLLVGQRLGFDALGPLAQLMLHAPSVLQALRALQRYLLVHDRGAVAYLRLHAPAQAALGYSVHDPGTPGVGLIHDLSITVAVAVLRVLCGPKWRPLEVHLPRRAPASPLAWRRNFGAPVQFEAAAAEVCFDAAWLAQRPPLADPARQLALLRAASRTESALALPLAERAQHAARVLLMTGALSAEHLAQLLDQHPRTLRRHLASEGTSLREIVSATRFGLARQLLAETRLPLSELSALLGYRDLTAFVRAFRAWANCAPGQWRVAAQRSGRRRPAA
ncbi:MAG: AraC family transcriptional regulator [Burkholderiales bacterium]|nr:AraC family transcriptional regulator [Burkholderiales bacterium]